MWKLDAKLQKESAICKCLAFFFQYEVAPLVLQEQIMQENHLRLFSIVTPLFLRPSSALPPLLLHRLSIAAPSLLHRNDGLSMDYRWITDGLS